MLVFMTAAGPIPSPPRSVLELFDATEALIRLPTGRGTAWRSGNLVLKPLDMTHRMLHWQARVLGGWWTVTTFAWHRPYAPGTARCVSRAGRAGRILPEIIRGGSGQR